jgi:hypothetical protein
MIYIGFVITVNEALRLLKLPDTMVRSFYNTEPIQKYLNEQKSELVFQYIDKGACLFGIEVSINDEKTGFPYAKTDDVFFQILSTKYAFQHEMERLGVDTSKVHITWIEEEEKLMENPQPYVIVI